MSRTFISMRSVFVLLSALLTFFFSCLSANEEQMTTHSGFYRISGPTMGTSYHITYSDSLGRNLKPLVDSLLHEINLSVSTYIDSSLISRFNQSDEGLDLAREPEELLRHFLINYFVAEKVYGWSAGYFDPTVMPLVNYWGFGYRPKGKREKVDSALVDSLRNLVGMQQLFLDSTFLKKKKPGMQLDFSAVAKGYAVDAVGDLLTSLGLCNWLVEIGGELTVSGHNPKGKTWKVGINTPEEDAPPTDFTLRLRPDSSCGYLWANFFNANSGAYLPKGSFRLRSTSVLSLPKDSFRLRPASGLRGVATSGNYRNFYEEDGEKFVHTIDPHTGYTRRSTLLSASVLAPSCAEADALATACMAMGDKDKALKMVEMLENVEACLIFVGPSGKREMVLSSGMRPYLYAGASGLSTDK